MTTKELFTTHSKYSHGFGLVQVELGRFNLLQFQEFAVESPTPQCVFQYQLLGGFAFGLSDKGFFSSCFKVKSGLVL